MVRFFFLGALAAELLSIVLVGAALGAGWTLLLIFGFMAAGVAMLSRVNDPMSRLGGFQIRLVRRGAVRFVIAALLFLSPGFFSDILGIILLMLPPLSSAPERLPEDDGIIEGEFTVRRDR